MAGGLLILSALVGAVVYSGFARQRRRVVLTYAPYKAGGSRAGSIGGVLSSSSPSSGLQSVMGTYDCIPADRLLGGGGGGVGSSSSSSVKKEKSGRPGEKKKDASGGGGAAADGEKTGVHITVANTDADASSEYSALPSASSFVTSHAADAPVAAAAAPQATAAEAAAAAVAPPKTRRPIPLIGTNLDYDTEGYLFRFVSGIPFSSSTPHTSTATHKLIAWGGCDPMVASQIDTVLTSRPDFRVYRSREKQGCAAGWNVILRYMAMHDREEVPW